MLADDMQRYKELKEDLAKERKNFRERIKPKKDELELIKASIVDAVIKAGKTIQIGEVKAEFVPTVVIKKVKEGE